MTDKEIVEDRIEISALETPLVLGPLLRMRLSLSNGPSRVGIDPKLKINSVVLVR
jgi:hypothetical protein